MVGREKSKESPQYPRSRGRIGRKLVFSFVLLVMAVVGGSGWVLFQLTEDSLEDQMSEHLVAVAQLAADIPTGSLLRHRLPGTEGFSIYHSLRNDLRKARDQVGARRIYIFDRGRGSLLDTEPGIPIGQVYHHLNIRDRLEMAAVWAGEPTHSVRFRAGDVYYMTGYAPIFDQGEVVAAVGVDIGAGFMDAIHVFERSVFVFAGFGVLLTILVGLWLGRNITLPLKRLVRAAREIGHGKLEQAIEIPSTDEVGDLAETMEEMRRQLLARDAQLRQMLAGVAHEIRNPLGGIQLYAGVIAADLPAEDARRQHIEKVIDQVRVLNKVIEDFLEFARPATPSPEQVQVLRLVEDAVFLLAPEMDEAGVEFTQEVADPLWVSVDREQIKRVLFNLIKNGVQAMRSGGSLRLGAGQRAKQVWIEVEDSGPGIDPKLRAHLFDPFFTTKEKGSGLGLALVRQILEENGGSIEVDSVPGQGAIFRVWLPKADLSQAVETKTH